MRMSRSLIICEQGKISLTKNVHTMWRHIDTVCMCGSMCLCTCKQNHFSTSTVKKYNPAKECQERFRFWRGQQDAFQFLSALRRRVYLFSLYFFAGSQWHPRKIHMLGRSMSSGERQINRIFIHRICRTFGLCWNGALWSWQRVKFTRFGLRGKDRLTYKLQKLFLM